MNRDDKMPHRNFFNINNSKSDSNNSKEDLISRFVTDITELANNNMLDPVIGRRNEIRKIMQVLLRKTKSCPILVGDPGIGKTALVYGLALAISNKEVPGALQDCKILSLDFTSVLAGAKYKGDFEERMKNIIDALKSSNGKSIVFIDEIHMIVGKNDSSAMDAANMLKHSLASGEIKCIGATTFDEYREYIERDKALSRRFQSVHVFEPNKYETLAILRGLKSKYESHHGVKILDEALIEAVKLSDIYINDRSQPDKSIDLMDEAATSVRLEYDSMPEEVGALENKILEMKMALKSIKHDSDGVSQYDEKIKKNIQEIEENIEKLSKEYDVKLENWKKRNETLREYGKIKNEINTAKKNAELSKKAGDFDVAAKLIYSIIPDLESKISKFDICSDHGAVNKDTISHVIHKWTGIPINKLLGNEIDKLKNLEANISQYIAGQSRAISSIANTIRRNKVGISSNNKPIGSFLFLGPTGVGKTETAKVIADILFMDKKAITILDMSEYMEKHSVSKILGAPPGYLGYLKNNTVFENVKNKPYQLILFDEIEKAHPDVLNILLQILDEGRATDSSGRVINFCNTIIVMTSNIGAHLYGEGDYFDSEIEANVIQCAKSSLKPEFLNRIDSIVVFHSLNQLQILQICKMELSRLSNRVLSSCGIDIKFNDSVADFISKQNTHAQWGGREIKRIITRYIENELSMFLLDNKFQHGDFIVCNLDDLNKISFKIESENKICK